jgi:hypothetical protein
MRLDAVSAGLSLNIDATSSATWMHDKGAVQKSLTFLISDVGMKPLGTMLCEEVDLDPEKLHCEDDEGGVSYIQMLTTSHVSIHCWPLRSRFSFDLFSCKNFDPTKVITSVHKSFEVVDMCYHVIERSWP